MGEAMVAIVLADHCLRQRAQRVLASEWPSDDARGDARARVEGGGSER
jgi:hypothetical protein